MTGFHQVVAKKAEQDMAALDTNYVEVTWHHGARPTHQVWQGKVYFWDRGFEDSLAEPLETLDNSAESGIIKLGNNGLFSTKLQIGKKIGKHAADFGFDIHNEKSREEVLQIISDIYDNYDVKVSGMWRGQGGLKPDRKNRYDGKVDFYIKGNDVVVAKGDMFVTVLKDGKNNLRVKKALLGGAGNG